MEENVTLLEEAIRELQEARRRTRSRKICERIDRAVARIHQVHHNLTT